MSKGTMRLALALLLGLAAAGPAALRAEEMPEAQATAIRQGVQATLDAHGKLSAAGSWEALMRLYADEPRFRWMSNGTIVARSVDEIRKTFLALPPGSRFETTYQDVEITPLAPGVAQMAAPFHTRVVDPKSGGYAFGGFLTMILVERADGWKILSGHASSSARNGR